MRQQAQLPSPSQVGSRTSNTQPANASYGSFLHDIIFVCCGTIGAAYLVLLLVGVPIAMIYFGYTTRNQCPAEPMIPIYLLITGVFSIFRTIWYALEFWIFRRRPSLSISIYQWVDTVMCVLTAGMATVYLLGFYWVLNAAWPNLENETAFNYCNPSTYMLAFVTVIGVLVLILFWCMCVCTLAFQVVPVVNEQIVEVGIPIVGPPSREPQSVRILVFESSSSNVVTV